MHKQPITPFSFDEKVDLLGGSQAEEAAFKEEQNDFIRLSEDSIGRASSRGEVEYSRLDVQK